MNPIQKYHSRFLEIKSELNLMADEERLLELIKTQASDLNNYFMAALGMSTLMVRLGGIIQMCRKFNRLDEHGDALFMKQVLDNLRETLPSDTSWKVLWEISAQEEEWTAPIIKTKKQESLLSRFITFRNRFVHQQITISEDSIPKLKQGVLLFDEMANLFSLFKNGKLTLDYDKYYWEEKGVVTCLHPFIQQGEKGEDAYIFQGLYYNKEKAHLLNMQLGDALEQKSSAYLEPTFEPFLKSIKGGSGKVFDHSERMAYYQSCFVGRERESDAIMEFCNSQDEKNILCVKSVAGMGKGALVADVISQLQKEKKQVLYHFCGAGMQNSLHAALYHFILQGNRQQYWNRSDKEIQEKLNRLPSKYVDVIHLFHNLLDDQLKIGRNNTSGNLVIIIDGLDEAKVAYSQLRISDWFQTYNEKEEPEDDWRSASNIRWVFTYRCDDDGLESFYQFPNMKESTQIDILQPLQGLSIEAVNEAFKEFKVSGEFKEAVVEKAKI